DRALVIEAARGRVLGQHPAPWTGPWPYVHEVHQTRGACAWLGPCGIQPFDCQDGRPLGEYRPSPEIHLYGLSDDPSEHDTSCSPSPRLLGRHEDVIVLTAAAASEAPVLVGLAADTGQPRWQQPLPADLAPAGLTDDGGCWVLDESTPRVDVLDCRDGTLRWQQGIGPGALEVQAVGDVLVVAREHGGRWRLSAYATADGRPGWSARLARRQHPVLPGGPVRDAQLTGTRRVYALVDPARAGVVGELVAGRDERLWPDPSGGFLLIGRELRELDAEGRLTRQRPFTGTRVHTVTAGHVLTHDGQTIEIYDRDQLRERARIEGRLSIQAEDRLPADRLLLRRHGDDGVALVLGLEAPSRSGTYR
ncbi:MAG: PQQ-binding-like beta-propeller repeat protein, partial [Myxococcales bacterium]|nr:PQQ-binding-like beta-propeller repeat protein [Myxococcales bacterium]